MSYARVVQEQDSTVPPVKMAVRVRPPRSNPIGLKALVVRRVVAAEIRSVIIKHHYLHAMPTACWRCFGVFVADELVGAAVFTAGPRLGYRVLVGAKPQQVLVLARLWLRDDLPKNAESRVIGVLLRELRRERRWKLVLSYADPAVGHAGTIYKASGWIYLGRGQPGRYFDLGDGQPIHPRTAHNRFGANNIGHLRRTGIDAKQILLPGKHRFAYLLDPAWRWRLQRPAIANLGRADAS